MRRHLLKTNSINAFLQGKSSNIFYDDNYLPLSSNPYKYLGKPGLEDNNSLLEKLDEIPISSSDISKKDVELYVINLPGDLAEEQIKELLNTALISIEANDKIGNPIINAKRGKNGKFFILEFRTPNECKNAMNLNGMKILNRTLKIGQPNYLCEKDGNKCYIQVCTLLINPDTIKREFGPLFKVKDQYDKYVFSMDEHDMSYEGIKHVNIIDFLTNDTF